MVSVGALGGPQESFCVGRIANRRRLAIGARESVKASRFGWLKTLGAPTSETTCGAGCSEERLKNSPADRGGLQMEPRCRANDCKAFKDKASCDCGSGGLLPFGTK
jgi:hypothetical protein